MHLREEALRPPSGLVDLLQTPLQEPPPPGPRRHGQVPARRRVWDPNRTYPEAARETRASRKPELRAEGSAAHKFPEPMAEFALALEGGAGNRRWSQVCSLGTFSGPRGKGPRVVVYVSALEAMGLLNEAGS